MAGNIKYQQAQTNASDAHSCSVSVFEEGECYVYSLLMICMELAVMELEPAKE